MVRQLKSGLREMKMANPFELPKFVSRALVALVVFGAFLLAACGGPSAIMPPGPPSPPGMSSVTVLLTSAANDQLSQFDLAMASLSLTDQSGNSVTLFTDPSAAIQGSLHPEFIHLNGALEPLVTKSIPQGIYTSATLTVDSCAFTDITIDSATGGLLIATYAEGLCGQGTGRTTINLPSPVAVRGPAVVLLLDLQVSQSFTLDVSNPVAPYTISPVFTLTPVTVSAQPTNDSNGKITGLNVQIASVSTAGNGFVAKTSDGFSLNIASNAGTVFQGIAGFSSLAAGMLANMDLAIQSDGSLLATRVEIDDAAQPAAFIGPFLGPFSGVGNIGTFPLELEGCVPGGVPVCGGSFQFNNNTAFKISGQFTNLQNLPFTASFNSSIFLPGQNVSVFSSGLPNAQTIAPAATITLAPETINGTVTAVTIRGGFSVFTIALAPYDLIPVIQGTPGPFPRVTSPTTVTVYADSNTQLLTSALIGPGSLARFRGLIFNDSGALRMDCGQILDGVPE